MVLQEHNLTLEEVQAEWMDALDRALEGSDEDWSRFIIEANDSGPDFTPEEDAEDIAFIRELEAKEARGEVEPSIVWDDEYDRVHDPELYEFFQRLDREFPENMEMRLDRALPTPEGREFMRRLKSEFPEALHLFMIAMPVAND